MNYKGNEITFGKEDTKCSECGTAIRNVVFVNGHPIGCECARKYLPKAQKLDSKSFALALENQRKENNRKLHNELMNFVMSGLKINRTDEYINQSVFLALRDNQPQFVYWLAYQEARKLQSQM